MSLEYDLEAQEVLKFRREKGLTIGQIKIALFRLSLACEQLSHDNEIEVE